MAKIVKGFLWGVLSLFLLFVIAIIVVSLKFDPNAYKSNLQNEVFRLTGRNLEIAGDIHLAYYPRLAVEVGAVRLNNPPGFLKPLFAKSDHAEVVVKFLPLLHGKMEVEKIILKGAELRLITKVDGQKNWDFQKANSSAVTKDETSTKKETTQASSNSVIVLPNISLEDLQIEDGTLIWDNGPNKQLYQFTHVNFRVSDVSVGNTFPLSFSGEVLSTIPAITGKINLKATVGSDFKNVLLNIDNLSFNGNMEQSRLSEIVKLKLQYDLQSQNLKCDPINIQGEPLVVTDGALTKTGDAWQLQMNRIQMKDKENTWLLSQLKALMTIAQGNLTLNKASVNAYDGEIIATGLYHLEDAAKSFNLQMKMNHIDSAPVAKNLGLPLNGELEASVDLTGQLGSVNFLSTLSGQSSFAINKGELLRIDVPALVSQVKLLIQKPSADSVLSATKSHYSTPFSRLGGSFDLRSGNATTQDLKLETQWMTIFMKGNANLVNQTMYFEILGKPTRENEEDIPLVLKGSFQHPLLLPNLEVLLKKEAKKQLKQLDDHLDKQLEKLGPGAKEVRGLLDKLLQ